MLNMFEEKEAVLMLQDRYGLRSAQWNTVTIRITKWYYYGPRVKLTIVEGYHNREDIDNAVRSQGKDVQNPSYPKNLEIICRPEEMLQLAKTITKVCES